LTVSVGHPVAVVPSDGDAGTGALMTIEGAVGVVGVVGVLVFVTPPPHPADPRSAVHTAVARAILFIV
jgi:hypothetical protein